ncbi:SAM-dependent methyltransferase [Nocardia mexicana]|uniref:S-adenosyl-L-methionine-dependent methyltransferase n=1 Tax=Nocardia mexicana TaxID=279262 RepID=A0A370H8E0_9NOCA|nr:SAM-dependent methyltransferase [Nocardia mexicana]RDI52901.1 methyltransferase (TIGR00027 family) [Nocardia mexicana]
MGTTQGGSDAVSLNGIGETSLGVAALRAMENQRADRLFEDPYAQRLLDRAGGWTMTTPVTPASGLSFIDLMAGQVAIRTRFLDEVLLDAAGDSCGQVVLLASGMDARPYRLPWPAGTRLFEVDFGEVLTFKRDALRDSGAQAHCAHVQVAADLRADWPETLRRAGFDANVPTIWLAEGILYALPADAADVLLARMTELSAPGSELAADHVEDSPLLRAARAAISDELVRLWRGGPVDDLDTWLGRHGWKPAVREIATLARSYRRPVPPAFDPDLDGSGRGWLITARLQG